VKEAWGLVVNEAMNCGLPVVATDAVGAAAGGLVVNGETGLVVPERNAPALASALDQLLGDPAARARLAAAAAERVLELSFEASADAFEHAVKAAILHRESGRRKKVPCVS
jgi:glycosyltransferase involved in cell wall biosynthesis